MTNIQYHGKVYRSKESGRLFTKTPNGNVLYKHPVCEPTSWTASKVWAPEDIDYNVRIGFLVEVNEN